MVLLAVSIIVVAMLIIHHCPQPVIFIIKSACYLDVTTYTKQKKKKVQKEREVVGMPRIELRT